MTERDKVKLSNRLFSLPPEILSRVYDYEGGVFYKNIYSYYVLPSMIKQCWKRWMRKYTHISSKSYMSYFKQIFPIDYLKEPFNMTLGIGSNTSNETDISIMTNPNASLTYTDYFIYLQKKKEFNYKLSLLEYIEKKYWHRMYISPLDTLSLKLFINYNTKPISFVDIDDNLYNYFSIRWKKCKKLPYSIYVDGIVIEESLFHLYYVCLKQYNEEDNPTFYYYNVNDYHCLYPYRIIHYSKKYRNYILESMIDFM